MKNKIRLLFALALIGAAVIGSGCAIDGYGYGYGGYHYYQPMYYWSAPAYYCPPGFSYSYWPPSPCW